MYDIASVSFWERSYLFYPGLFDGNSLGDFDKLYSPRSLTPLLIGEQVHVLLGQNVEKARAFDVHLIPTSQNSNLLANWADVITDHPLSYFKHRLDVFLALVTRFSWGLWAPEFDS